MKFIRRIELKMDDNTLIVHTNTRNFPFIYHYDTNAWQLQEGDAGENLTASVLKFCDAASMKDVVKDYIYKHYMELFQSQVHNITSKTGFGIFSNAQNLQVEIYDALIEPVMETIENLKQFIDTYELEKEVKAALINLYGMGSEEIIKKTIIDYDNESIEFDNLSEIFYKYIDYIKKYDKKLAEKFDKQMDVFYKQSVKNNR